MQMPGRPGSGKTALLFGVLFGVSLGIVQPLVTFFAGGVGFFLGILVAIGACFLAGMLGARRTGSAATGALAGLWVGIISSIIVLGLFTLLILTVGRDAFLNGVINGVGRPLTPQQAVHDAVVGGVIVAIIWLFVGGGAGAGIGAIGGLIGKNMSPVAQPYQPPAFYPQAQVYQQPWISASPVPPTQPPYPPYGPQVAPGPPPNIPYPPPPSVYEATSDERSSSTDHNPYADPEPPPYSLPGQS